MTAASNAATANAATTDALPASSRCGLSGGDRLPPDDQTGQQEDPPADPGDDVAPLAAEFQGGSRRDQPAGRRCGHPVPACGQSGGFPGRVDTPHVK